MGLDPLKVIAECLGEPADSMRAPATLEYRCPFIDNTCIKFNRTLGVPVPVCSIYKRGATRPTDTHAGLPVCICPKRFFETDIVEDIVRECWVGAPPSDRRIAYEVQMEKFGKVDLVIADVNEGTGTLSKFLPVELQAVDITGSYLPVYEALIQSAEATGRVSYGFNWANVRKRFISQLIAKGFYCHQWGTRIVAVVQENLFDQFTAHARITESSLEDSNIVFMLYQYERANDNEPWSFRFRRKVPTTHVSVMNSILYETPPSKAAFERKVIERFMP